MKWHLLRNGFPLPIVLLLALASPASSQLSSYSQDFESMAIGEAAQPNSLSNDGWVVFGNVFDAPGGNYLYGYGPFPAPNDGAAFCAVDSGQGGAAQGSQQLSVYSDYNNADHANGFLIESNVFQERTILPVDVGNTWVFTFDAKRGNLGGSSTALAFIKTIDTSSGFLSKFIRMDMTNTPTMWTNYALFIPIDAGLIGHVLQFGFLSTATLYEPSGIYYDNLTFALDPNPPVDVPGAAIAGPHALLPATPNPSRGATEIRFSLPAQEPVRIDVFDVTGRRVARLLDRTMPAGEHRVTWSGLDTGGRPVASGTYFFRMEARGFSETRNLIKLR